VEAGVDAVAGLSGSPQVNALITDAREGATALVLAYLNFETFLYFLG
jgi:hypothetical protein